jgi:hypothetical protein
MDLASLGALVQCVRLMLTSDTAAHHSALVRTRPVAVVVVAAATA